MKLAATSRARSKRRSKIIFHQSTRSLTRRDQVRHGAGSDNRCVGLHRGVSMKIAISSGHGKYVAGASGLIEEVDEARRVVDRLGELIPDAVTFHENTATTQEQNLKNITNWHNAQNAELHVSVHFNAYMNTTSAMGCECLWVTQADLAARVAPAISNASGLINRG